jgi:Flp pilus assembly protein TadG
MNQAPLSFFHRLRRDRSGSVAMIAGVSIAALVGMSALVIDGGNVINAQRTLQASSSAAALAAAADIGSTTNPVTTATLYSSVAGSQNAHANLPGVTITTTLKCFSSTGVTCTTGVPPANGIVVTQQATVSTLIGSVLGIGSVNISATATAGSKGGKSKFLDVMLVLDTTASMNDNDTGCGVTKLNCALTGVRSLLSSFWPTVDQVGLMVFPPLTNSTQASNDYDCNSATPSIVPYGGSGVYQVIPLVTDYRTSNTAPLNTASNLVKAARGGASGCTQGITAVGGEGTYYADAITAAQAALATTGRANVQRVIILLSDGDASAKWDPVPSRSQISTSAKGTNECKAAIAAALAAKTATPAPTWVYSIAYGASSSGCSTDTSPGISPCATMQQIASDSTKFFSSDASCSSSQSITQLNQIFKNIGTDLTSGRLLSNGAT